MTTVYCKIWLNQSVPPRNPPNCDNIPVQLDDPTEDNCIWNDCQGNCYNGSYTYDGTYYQGNSYHSCDESHKKKSTSGTWVAQSTGGGMKEKGECK
jgi:hypothetical protein